MRVGIDARKLADFGIGTYIRGLLRGLVELNAGDEYVAFAPAGVKLPDGVEHAIVDAPHYSIRELLAVGRAADRARLDVFHAPHYVVPFTRVPVVVTIHDLIHLHQPLRNPIAKPYARFMLRRAVHKARCVLTVSNAVRMQIEKELGAKNVIVTPNGVDAANGVKSEEVRVKSGVAQTLHSSLEPLHSDYFLFVGNDKPHKNAGTAVEAAKRAGVKLVLVGGSFERFGGRGFVSDEELSRLYANALALVMPSVEEGFGLPAAEAMAHGTPVISSTAPALVEITGDAALHVDAQDVDGFAEAMRRIANDASLRATLGAKGRERARLFTWKRCAEATRDAYERARIRGTSWNVG